MTTENKQNQEKEKRPKTFQELIPQLKQREIEEYGKVRKTLSTNGFETADIDRFLLWHHFNRHVWFLVKAYALELISGGAKHVGMKNVFEHVRFLASNGFSEKRYEVNNSYSSFYARIFCAMFPQYRDRFEFRNVGNLQEFKQTSLELREGQ